MSPPPAEAQHAAAIRICRGIAGIYLAGFYAMYAQWVQLLWLTGGLIFLAVHCGRQAIPLYLWNDRIVLLGLGFLGWMTVRSLLADGESRDAYPWIGGLLWLLAFAAVVWQAGTAPAALETWGLPVAAVAAATAASSILLYYFLPPGHHLSDRLPNVFMFGGFNPVCTGLTYGFAALWLICLKRKISAPRHRWVGVVQVILLLAIFFTRSRGALLALTAGQITLTLCRGWRKTWPDWLVLAFTFLIFQAAITFVSDITSPLHQPPSRLANPVSEMIDRADSGRLPIYRAGLGALLGPASWLCGMGEWGSDPLWKSLVPPPWEPDHLHSAYLATLVHGGLIGLGLLLLLLMAGLRRAFQLARGGQDTWLILLCSGLVALLFDGHTLTRMNSLPLFEPLLLTFPLVAAASAWAHRDHATPQAARKHQIGSPREV